MGYCCNDVTENANIVSSRKIYCADTAIDERTLTIQTSLQNAGIKWFHRAVNSTVFNELTAYQDLTQITTQLLGEWRVLVSSENGTVIVRGTTPCQAIIETPEMAEFVKFARVNTYAELVTLKNSGQLQYPAIYFVVATRLHYYADANNSFEDSTQSAENIRKKGVFKDDTDARMNGLATGDVYETSNDTNYSAGSAVLKVVRDA